MGRTIKTDHYNGMPPGRHTYIWNGTNDFGKAVSTGIYFIQIDAGHESAMKKMLLLK
jgi:flagellar hook assembly protein FlgD